MTSTARSGSSMRVALIDDTSSRLHVEGLARGLARHGHFVDIYRTWTPGQATWEDLQAGVRIHRVAPEPGGAIEDQGSLSRAVHAFAEHIRRLCLNVYPCDVIHACGLLPGLVGLRLTRGVAVPLIVNLGAPYDAAPLLPGDGAHEIESLLARRADRIVLSSAAECEALCERHGIPGDKAWVLPPGVDAQRFKPHSKAGARTELGLPAEAFTVLWSQPVPRDEHDRQALWVFLKALQRADIHVLLVGQGNEDRAAFRHLPNVHVVDLGALDVARQSVLSQCHVAADVLVCPDGSGRWQEISPREAMACGLPVVMMNAREQPEWPCVVQDGVSGVLLRRARPDALVERLVTLRDEPHRRAAMSMAAVLRARTYFTWDKMALQHVALYTQASVYSRIRRESCSLTLIRTRPALRSVATSITPSGSTHFVPADA